MKHGYPSFDNSVVDYAKKIKEHCMSQEYCDNCIFIKKDKYLRYCGLKDEFPCEWDTKRAID